MGAIWQIFVKAFQDLDSRYHRGVVALGIFFLVAASLAAVVGPILGLIAWAGGWPILGAVATLVVALGLGIVGFIGATPIAYAVDAFTPATKLGDATRRTVLGILFVELSIGMYLMIVPMHLASLPALLVAALVLATGAALWGGTPWGRKIAMLTATVLVVGITMMQFGPQTIPGAIARNVVQTQDDLGKKIAAVGVTGLLKEAVAEEPRSTQTARYTTVVPLLGEDVLSDAFDWAAVARPGWSITWTGPTSTTVVWDDGEEGPFTKDWNGKIGVVRFKGPAGKTVVIRILPPR